MRTALTPGDDPMKGNVLFFSWMRSSETCCGRGSCSDLCSSNLRLTVPAMTEDAWVAYIKTFRPRPPMPWWSMKETTEPDLRAMYQYIKSLGPAGQHAQAYLPPDQEPKQPYNQAPLPPK